MHARNLQDFIKRNKAALSDGPIAIILVEDDVEVASTLRHHAKLGFRTQIVLMPAGLDLPPDASALARRIDYDALDEGAMETAVNAIAKAAAGQWIYYCFNAEYLFFPFCETRTIGEMLSFHAQERRAAMLTYVVDLYADDLARFPNAVSLEHAFLDSAGYYAEDRTDPVKDHDPRERQLDFFGGLRWRFEEHVPYTRRRIDRIGLFRAKRGLRLLPDHRLNDEEYNTYTGPWHHNLTATICSFRTAKALRFNPGSRAAITTFKWQKSMRFEWRSRQLMDLGLMEPGQWF